MKLYKFRCTSVLCGFEFFVETSAINSKLWLTSRRACPLCGVTDRVEMLDEATADITLSYQSN